MLGSVDIGKSIFCVTICRMCSLYFFSRALSGSSGGGGGSSPKSTTFCSSIDPPGYREFKTLLATCVRGKFSDSGAAPGNAIYTGGDQPTRVPFDDASLQRERITTASK